MTTDGEGLMPVGEHLDALAALPPASAAVAVDGAVDLAAQLLGARLVEASPSTDPRLLLRTSFSQKVSLLEGVDSELARLVTTFRKRRSSATAAADAPAIAGLVDVVRQIAAHLSAEERPLAIRTTVGTRLVNSVSIDTMSGYRSFSLLHGDVTAVKTDLLVISSHANPAVAPSGQVVSALHSRHGITIDPERRLLSIDAVRWTCFQRITTDAPCGSLLTLRLPASSDSAEPAAEYDRAIRGTYASIAALEHLGERFPVISMPVLYGQRIVDYRAALESLLRHAVVWLKSSEHTHTIQFVIQRSDELGDWDGAMNLFLGRSFIAAGNDAVLDSLCREIAALAHASNGTALQGATVPLLGALAARDSLCIESVCVFGRKLVELIAKQLLARSGIAEHPMLMNNIEALGKHGKLAPWILSYMHSLRIFGNETVHGRGEASATRPTRLSRGDLVSALCAIRALLAFAIDEGRSRPEGRG